MPWEVLPTSVTVPSYGDAAKSGGEKQKKKKKLERNNNSNYILDATGVCTQYRNTVRKTAIKTNCTENFKAGTLSRNKQKIIRVSEANVSPGTEKYICH